MRMGGRGAWQLAAACGAAWLSFSTVFLALLLQVDHVTGSFAAAGAGAAVFGLASAAAGVPRSRAVDRHGARRVLPWLGAAHVVALLAVALGEPLRLGAPALIALIAVASASTPPLIAVARSEWSRVLPPGEEAGGYAVTALAGDVSQVAGPALAGALAVLVDPAAGVVVAAGLAGVSTVMIVPVADRRDASAGHSSRPDSGAMRYAGLRTVTAAGLGLGMALGALDVVLPALATQRGMRWSAGILLGAIALGSVVASLYSPRLGKRHGPSARYAIGLGVFAAASVPLPLKPPLLALLTLLPVAGFAWGLVNVSLYELLDRVVPPLHATEAWTWLATAEALGGSGGAALGGVIVDHAIGGALALPAAGVIIAALTVRIRWSTLTPDHRATQAGGQVRRSKPDHGSG
jgi:MFS family permease